MTRTITLEIDDATAASLDVLADRAGLDIKGYLEAFFGGEFDDPTRPTRRERRKVAAQARAAGDVASRVVASSGGPTVP